MTQPFEKNHGQSENPDWLWFFSFLQKILGAVPIPAQEATFSQSDEKCYMTVQRGGLIFRAG